MKHMDRLVAIRLGTRIGTTLLVFYGLIALVETLDTWRFNHVANAFGLHMAIFMVSMSAIKWMIRTMPVTVLMGAIIGFIDLKARHELTIIQTSGMSIWRIIRAPLIGIIIFSLMLTLGLETFSTQINRWLNPTPPGAAAMLTPPGEIWLEQRGSGAADTHYIIFARSMKSNGSTLGDITLFQLSGSRIRLEAPEAHLQDGHWLFPTAVLRTSSNLQQKILNYQLPTASSAEEISLKLSSVEDSSFFELVHLLQAGVASPEVHDEATMRAFKLLSMPLVLAGSLLIAFAFTAGYRRGAGFDHVILHGIVLGFVVFIITEMADRAGSTGVLEPVFAAIGPAFIAIVIGVTVLLCKEDGFR